MDSNKYSDFILNSDLDRWWDLPREHNVSDYILRKATEHFNNGLGTFIKNPKTGESVLYQDILTISKNIASTFYKLGLRKGDTVIYSTHNPIKLYVFMLGIWRANGIVRSCYPEETGHALVTRIKESRATFLACDDHIVKECLEASKVITDWPIKVINFGKAVTDINKRNDNLLSIEHFDNDDGSALPEPSIGLDDIALVLPTSGTTGDSKGAVYTHKILLENLIYHEMMPYTDRDREPTIITSRQTHYVGSIGALSFLTSGRYLLMMPSVTVNDLLELTQKFKVRSILAFPTYLTGMAKHPDLNKFDLSSIRYLTTAGQIVAPKAMESIKKGFPRLANFINLYGMTESGLLTSSADWKALKLSDSSLALPYKDFSVGRLPPGTNLKVVDMDEGEKKLHGPNSKGELCFKTPLTSAGYVSRPEENAKTFMEDGWVRTGDIGYYDEDGFIYLIDRAKEVFKWNSNHVSPTEIEDVLLRHPKVSQAGVIGVPGENDEGFIPRGFVVLEKGKHEINPSVVTNELIQFTNNNLPPYKHLKGGLFILPELPVGKTGKVTRQLLSKLELPS